MNLSTCDWGLQFSKVSLPKRGFSKLKPSAIHQIRHLFLYLFFQSLICLITAAQQNLSNKLLCL